MVHIKSKIGGRTENQDFYGSAQTHFGELIVVCDGMGGQNGGRCAAEMAVDIIINEVSKSKVVNPIDAVSEAITKANTAIWQESHLDKSLKGMGTTVVALLITSQQAISFHVGDSRIYQLRNGIIKFRTFDHSHVFEMVKAGLINEEQARLSEKSNIITQGLGTQLEVDISITDGLSYKKGDRFLLCTDGICGAVPENELVEMASLQENIEIVLNELLNQIDAIGAANGSNHDNMTAALFEMESDSSLKKIEEKNQNGAHKTSKSRGKFLIYILLIALFISIILNIYFIFSNKSEVMNNKPIIINNIPTIDSKKIDTSKILKPVKK